MIRIIVRTDNAGMAANVGGSVETSFRTFDVELPDLEAHLCEGKGRQDWLYVQRQVIGWELLPKSDGA